MLRITRIPGNPQCGVVATRPEPAAFCCLDLCWVLEKIGLRLRATRRTISDAKIVHFTQSAK